MTIILSNIWYIKKTISTNIEQKLNKLYILTRFDNFNNKTTICG